MAITYNAINESERDAVTDLISKRESVEGALADIQTERANAEIGWAAKEQELRAEQNRLTEDVRKVRKATIKA